MHLVHVAVGVVVNGQGKILISLRPDHLHQGGLWEFPGGKVDAGESVEIALVRELKEELGITARQYHRLMEVRHDYGDKQVLLDVWIVDSYRGHANGCENQQIAWVYPVDLEEYCFPAANRDIVERIKQLSISETIC